MIIGNLAEEGVDELHFADVHDYLLQRRLVRYSGSFKIRLKVYDSPGFLISDQSLKTAISSKSKRFFLHDFYVAQRKRLNVLMDSDDPIGGKWSFDHENRKKIPEKTFIPSSPPLSGNNFVQEAKRYVKTNFSHHYGSPENFTYPISRSEALYALEKFLVERFTVYGVYQDAIKAEDSVLFHSLLTPALNIGLLTPDEILQRAIDFGLANRVPLNSIEGFVRQILGWREFVRIVYTQAGVDLRKSDHWLRARKMPESFWHAGTGIGPVDNVIRKVLRTGYSNHIDRLMILGNFMLLCQFDPDDVYKWFMTLYIDAYDWVMVPNVYGMSQYADGGLMSTKPYISGSNYILKMSNFKKGPRCEIWDALYWGFIETHREEFMKNPGCR